MTHQILPADFYARDPIIVAQQLLGKCLVRRSRAGLVRGRIVEVEAYLARNDPACHAFRGPTQRNCVMFGPAGRLYVYAIHSRYCLNAVTECRGMGSAVLIRAVEPLEGIRLMQVRRGKDRLLDLARGPARLCEALDVDRRLDGWDLTRGRQIWIEEDPAPLTPWRMGRSPRIGVTSAHDWLLRFFVEDNPFVSGRRTTTKGTNSTKAVTKSVAETP
jgi:DNA-3-methyladenine glycosylase